MNTSTITLDPPHPVLSPPAAPERPDYHRIARTQANYRWWRPLVTAVVAVAAYLAMMLLLFAAAAVAVLIDPRLAASLDAVGVDGDMYDPFQFFSLMASLILMIPAVIVGVAAGRRPVGTILSVAGRLRWGVLGRSLAICLSVYVASQLLVVAMAWLAGEPVAPTWQPYSWWLILAALLIVPLQAAAEEFACRALPMQVFGAWLRNPFWGILLPLPLFVAGHTYNVPGLISVAGFALAAGVLVWRTGGLEAAIVLHAVNNSLGFAFGAIGLVDLNGTEVAAVDAVASIATVTGCTVLILWVERKARRSPSATSR